MQCEGVILATDSPTLNVGLLQLAIEVSPSRAPIKMDQVSTLAYKVMNGVPIEEDFRAISEADQVVFQDKNRFSPPFTNQRVSKYEQYVRHAGYVPIRIGDNVSVYSMHCRPQSASLRDLSP